MLLRRFILAATLAGAAFALLMEPATAQMPMPAMKFGAGPKQKTPDELAKEKAIDDAYRAANKKIPDKTVANDPWGNVRSIPSTGNGKQ
jgi:Spy/CpxP family protein refolding chaperone